MSSRLLIVAFLVVVVAAVAFLALDGSGDDSVAEDVAVIGQGGTGVTELAGGGEASVSTGLPQVLERPEVAPLEAVEVDEVALAAGPKPEGRLTGVLVDDDGTPIAGEPVALALRSDAFGVLEPADPEDGWELVARTTSGDDGRFELAAHRHVTHALVAGGERWPRTRLEPVVSGDDVVVRMADAHVLEGVVIDAETDAPVAGALVAAGSGYMLTTVSTDAEGRFSVGPVAGEDLTVAAWASGYDVDMQTSVAPVLGEVQLALGPPRVVEGRVIDAETSEAITDGEVTLRVDARMFAGGGDPLVPGEVVLHEVTVPLDDEGAFRVDQGVSTGFTLDVTSSSHHPSFYDRYDDRFLPDPSAIVVRMRPRVAIEGLTVVEQSGLPLAGTRVVLEADDVAWAETTSGSDGAFEIAFPDDWDGRGRVMLHAEHPDGLGARTRVYELSRPKDVLLVPRFTATVRVFDVDGPAAGAQVAIRSKSSETTLATTDAEGLAEIAHTVGDVEVERIFVLARHGEKRSLPLRVDLQDPTRDPDAVLELDLDSGFALRGVVTDVFGEPVPSALVRVNKGPVGHTDAEGRFELRPVEEDEEASVYVTADGFGAFQREDVWPTEELVVELTRIVEWGGRVVDTLSGEPITSFVGHLQVETYADGDVRFRSAGERVRRVSSEPGTFTVPLAEAGRYRISFEANGRLRAYSDVIDFDGVNPPPPADVAMADAAVFEARVVDTFGAPVPGLTVLVSPWSLAESVAAPRGDARRKSSRQRTDDEGLARFELGEGGAFRVALRGDAWFDDRRLDVIPGYPAEREYRVPATATLELTVVDVDGAPAPGTRVTLRSARGSRGYSISRRPLVRSPDGVLRIESLPAGSYRLSLRNRRFDDLDTSVTLGEGQFLPERLVMPARGSTGHAPAGGKGGKQVGGGNNAKKPKGR